MPYPGTGDCRPCGRRCCLRGCPSSGTPTGCTGNIRRPPLQAATRATSLLRSCCLRQVRGADRRNPPQVVVAHPSNVAIPLGKAGLLLQPGIGRRALHVTVAPDGIERGMCGLFELACGRVGETAHAPVAARVAADPAPAWQARPELI